MASRGLVLVVPIALHHRIAAGAEFAALADRHSRAVGVDDLDLDMRMDAADGRDALFERIVDMALERDRAGLGHAVGDGHLGHMHRARRPSS